jgi:adenosylcobinamide-phosphate synthase
VRFPIDASSALQHFRAVSGYPSIVDEERAAVLVAALSIDFVIGWIPFAARFLAVPSQALAALAAWLEAKLNRPQRTAAARVMRGAVVVILGVFLAGAAGFALAASVQGWAGRWLVEGIVVLLFLRGREILADVGPVGRALRDQSPDAARAALAGAAPRATSDLDDHAVARGAVELAAQRFASGVVAPALWYLAAGPVGFLAYCGVSLCADRAAPYHSPTQPYGAPSRAVQFVLDLVPAPLAGVLLSAAAAFVPTASTPRALRTMLADSRRCAVYGAGWTIAAAAGALGLALAGPTRAGKAAGSADWIGQGRARANGVDVQRSLYLVAVGWLLLAAALGVVALAAAGN